MKRFELTIKRIGKKAVLIEWPQEINDSILEDIIQFKKKLLHSEGNKLINHIPAFTSILLWYREEVNWPQTKQKIFELYEQTESTTHLAPLTWYIPVCYDPGFALDMSSFERQGLMHKEVVSLHTSRSFRVYMIGFLPGFVYLGDLPKALEIPRKSSPTKHIPKGSIAIGGNQTGIYPMDSPGGWHVIGRTHLSLFAIDRREPCFLQQGDYVRFYSIEKPQYDRLVSS